MNHRPTTEGEQPGSLSWSIVLDLTTLDERDAVGEAWTLADRRRDGVHVTLRVGDTLPTAYDSRIPYGLVVAREKGLSITIEGGPRAVHQWHRALRDQPDPHPPVERHLQLVTT